MDLSTCDRYDATEPTRWQEVVCTPLLATPCEETGNSINAG